MGQLRHLYVQLVEGLVTKQAEAAKHLLSPAIKALELADQAEAAPAAAQPRDLQAEKDAAYRERDRVVALVARMAISLGWRAGLRSHEPDPDPTWDEDWKNVVLIDLPSGQVSWHYHDSERPLFASLPPYPDHWDGHDTAEKYRRVEAAAAQPPPDLARLMELIDRRPGPLLNGSLRACYIPEDELVALRAALAGAAQPQAEGAPGDEGPRRVCSEVFAALVKAGPKIGDVASYDLAHAVAALAKERDEAREAGRREGLEEAALQFDKAQRIFPGEAATILRALAASTPWPPPRPETPPTDKEE
jgi:hypothetical protein